MVMGACCWDDWLTRAETPRHPTPRDMTQLLATMTTPAAMAVRSLRQATAVVGTDMEAWDRFSAKAEFFMSLPGFDQAEFSQLAQRYGVG